MRTLHTHRFAPASGAAVVLVLSFSAACASTGASFRSGVGDKSFDRPPYYAGAAVSRDSGDRIAHFPVAYQRGASQSPIFDPAGGGGSAVAALLAEMNAYVDSLGASTRLSVASVQGTPPDVHFGCEADASDECTGAGETTPGDERRRLKLWVGRPSESWTSATRAALDAAGAGRSLVLTLEVGQYFTRQKNLLGAKEVQLGTDYSMPTPWLTSLETPVSVLQITGAVLDRDGRAIRIGAEGIFPRRTRLTVSAIGAQEILSDEDVQRARTLRREDLPGSPLAWQVALRTLVGQLTGRAL